jgi:hypothetical protein
MTRFLMFAVVLVGCRSERSPVPPQSTRELGVDGLKVQVPTGLVPLEDDRIQRLRDSYVRQEPGSEVSIWGVRGATLADATVYVAYSESHRNLPAGLRTVRDALSAAVQDTLDVLRKGGAKVRDLQATARNGGLETCVVAVFPEPQLPPSRLCALYYLAADVRLRTLSTTCMARDTALCERVLSSRTYAVTGALDLAKSLEVAPPPTGP